jgi:hypothetical protein
MLSKDVQQELQKPLIPIDQAVEQSNEIFEALIDATKEK